MFVSAGNDGTGAVREIGRIANGYGWKVVAEALIVRKEITPADLVCAPRNPRGARGRTGDGRVLNDFLQASAPTSLALHGFAQPDSILRKLIS